MRKTILLFGALCIALSATAQSTGERAAALYDRYHALRNTASTGKIEPAADGEHFLRRSAEGIEMLSYSDPWERELLYAADGRQISDYAAAPNGDLLIAYGSTPIYRHSFSVDRLLCIRGGETLEVSPEVSGKRDASFSPDGKLIAFSSGNDLYLFDPKSRTTRRLTDDGAWNRIINGTTDWVYEEEFGFTKGYAFSPDGQKLAYLRFDESEVPLFEMMRFDGRLYNRAYAFKYPKAGDRNSTVTIWTIDLQSGEKEAVYTGPQTDQYIPKLGWTPGGELYFYRVDRRQRLFEVVVDRPDEQQVIYSEQSPRYVERPIGQVLTFIDGDRFVVREETTAGWWHLYLHSMVKGRLKALTSGPWEVTALVHADKRGVWYLSTERSPLRRDLYRIDLQGRRKQRLTEGEGWHAIQPGAGMKYFVDNYSSAVAPNRISVRRGEKGEPVRDLVLKESPADRAYAAGEVPVKEFFTFRNGQGDELNAWMILPRDFDSTKRYPVLLTQYSGPGSQEVADRWRPDWTDLLPLEGYIVACVDPRGTGFRGEEFKKQTYGDLGRREVADQIDFARYWAAQPFVEAGRIGIYGWSYGGFMALSCALKGDGLFRMAIAVAPVTSWRYYDSVYTETYNGLPQEFPKGYDENSPLHFPEKLSPKTRLLLVHGSGDDNVHLQNTMEMARRLNRDGALYDMMIYPDQNHSMLPDDARNIRVKMLAYTLENL
ncbi:S9 family peptidase [uncultured Alistipes sp.]|uniref:S9 family peptidase n=1 Tax=uncultured Alistipes sp. TaxID=538949 RepID=UPI002629DCF2|nr:S9 family peptidase [uncultured Alistipes sp.]